MIRIPNSTFQRGCPMLIAVASKDGKQIDQHFGHAERFLIYDVGEGDAQLIDERKVERYCSYDQDHPLRAHILAALDCIDYVVIFDEDTPLRLIETLKPLVLVKGGDYTPDGVVGKDVVEAYGGRVELVEFVDGRSTTNIIEKILKTYG